MKGAWRGIEAGRWRNLVKKDRDKARYWIGETGTQKLVDTVNDLDSLARDHLYALIRDLQAERDELETLNEDLKQVQLELESSRDKYHEVYDFAPVGYITLSQDKEILEANLATMVMLGVQPSALKMRRFTDFIVPDSHEAFQCLWQEVFGTRTRQSGQVALLREDGQWLDVQLESTAMADANGDFIYCLIAIVDISVQKRAEREVQVMYDSEKRLREELEAEMKRRVEFTRVLAHEIKTPLTALLASSSALVINVKEEGPVLQFARMIDRSAVRLNNRVDEMLDLARGEIGILHLECRELDPSRLIREVAADMLPAAQQRGLKLMVDLPSELPCVNGDETRLRQVIYNLMNNALKFTPNGGTIRLRGYYESPAVIVEVADTGRGMAEEDLKTIFQPYERLARSKERATGLGLGLGLSRALVELHGGTIWVESQVGRGSRFAFSIPLKGSGAAD